MKTNSSEFKSLGCKQCLEANPLDFVITMAFQPIVDIRTRTVYAYEALVRGKDGHGAGEVLSWVDHDNRYTFDQTCRVKAIELASRLNMDCRLSINFLPNAVYRPETCIRATIEASDRFEFDLEKIMFEVTESEPVRDPAHLQNIFTEYKSRNFITALDDFGAGYAGLTLLSKFRPDVIKLDMGLCQGIADDIVKQSIFNGIVQTARTLEIEVIAEGIEHVNDLQYIRESGVYLIQGYIFSEPGFECLPEPDYSCLDKLPHN